MKKRLSRNKFYKQLELYQPLKFEKVQAIDLTSYPGAPHYALIDRNRFFLLFKCIINNLPLSNARIVDFGTYPGSFLRLLHILRPNDNMTLYGVGLKISLEFVSKIMEDCGGIIFEVNLDPANPDIAGRQISNDVPIKDGTVDYIHAGELIEHLVNPSWMLNEAARLLKPGGCLIMTTPNVCRIGNILKLMLGLTNYDRLQPIGNQLAGDEWRAHFREYSLKELADMLEKYGFCLKLARHYIKQEKRFDRRNYKKWCIEMLKFPFYAIQHFKGDILVVGEKVRK